MAEARKENAEKLVKIKLPLDKDHKDDVFVSVNERTWLIKRGVEVTVPECVKEVIRNREAMQAEAYDFEEKAQN